MDLDLDLLKILQLGPSKLESIGKSMSNLFWKEVLCTAKPMLEGAIFCSPESLLSAPIWENPLLKRNNRAIKPSTFATIARVAHTVGDFYKLGENTLMSHADFQIRHNVAVEAEDLVELRFIISTAVRSLGIQEEELTAQQLPNQPLLFSIATSCKKGCSKFYKILSQKAILNNKIHVRENSWHNEINAILSLDFWKNSYKLVTNI